jgi:hypothetical protein
MTEFKGNFSKGYAAKMSKTNNAGTNDQNVIQEMYKALVIGSKPVILTPQREYIVELGDVTRNLKGLHFKVEGLDSIRKISLLYADIARISTLGGVSITAGECDEAGEYIPEEGDTESFYAQAFPPTITLVNHTATNKMEWRRRQDGTPYYALREYAKYTTWPAFLASCDMASPEDARAIKEGGDIQPAIAKLVKGEFKDDVRVNGVDEFPLTAKEKKTENLAKILLPQLEMNATLSWAGIK